MPTVNKPSLISRGNIDEVAAFIKSLLSVALVGAVTKEEAYNIAKDTLARYIGVDVESITNIRTSVETSDLITEAIKICSSKIGVNGSVTGCNPSIVRDDGTDARSYAAKADSNLTATFISRSGDPIHAVSVLLSDELAEILDYVSRTVYFGHSYAAQDANGDWRSFSTRPTLNREDGVWRLERKTDDSRYVIRDATVMWPTGWADSLHHVVATTNVPRVVELIKVAD